MSFIKDTECPAAPVEIIEYFAYCSITILIVMVMPQNIKIILSRLTKNTLWVDAQVHLITYSEAEVRGNF
ncbi:MAG: hypothetical protein HC903_08770 [Methylacidiphilales bacterium]|nr:hypothetical protein [Candidatus Methylacidiphilales bacterium]NJR14590.1 hypothetical protein [Calothrix sp. CSU_2_0]